MMRNFFLFSFALTVTVSTFAGDGDFTCTPGVGDTNTSSVECYQYYYHNDIDMDELIGAIESASYSITNSVEGSSSYIADSIEDSTDSVTGSIDDASRYISDSIYDSAESVISTLRETDDAQATRDLAAHWDAVDTRVSIRDAAAQLSGQLSGDLSLINQSVKLGLRDVLDSAHGDATVAHDDAVAVSTQVTDSGEKITDSVNTLRSSVVKRLSDQTLVISELNQKVADKCTETSPCFFNYGTLTDDDQTKIKDASDTSDFTDIPQRIWGGSAAAAQDVVSAAGGALDSDIPGISIGGDSTSAVGGGYFVVPGVPLSSWGAVLLGIVPNFRSLLPGTCSPFQLPLLGYGALPVSLSDSSWLSDFREIFGWFLAVLTSLRLFRLLVQTVSVVSQFPFRI